MKLLFDNEILSYIKINMRHNSHFRILLEFIFDANVIIIKEYNTLFIDYFIFFAYQYFLHIKLIGLVTKTYSVSFLLQ